MFNLLHNLAFGSDYIVEQNQAHELTMKRSVLAGILTLAFALAGLAQGVIKLDDSLLAYGVAIDIAGNHYTGIAEPVPEAPI